MNRYDTPGRYRAETLPGAALLMFQPQTPVERELLAECANRARETGDGIATILAAAERYWEMHGKALLPRGWKARATAARRMIDRWVRYNG